MRFNKIEREKRKRKEDREKKEREKKIERVFKRFNKIEREKRKRKRRQRENKNEVQESKNNITIIYFHFYSTYPMRKGLEKRSVILHPLTYYETLDVTFILSFLFCFGGIEKKRKDENNGVQKEADCN